MKLSFFFLTVFAFSLSANSYSQTYRISMDKKATIAEIFSDIEANSEFSFLYSPREIDVTQQVSVSGKNLLITDVLSNMLAGKDIAYRITDRHIILYKADPSVNKASMEKQGIAVTGTVTDETGVPMPGVNVVIKGSATGTVTNIDGKYSIYVPNQESILAFSFIGYATQEMAVGDHRDIHITLAENSREIEEVVVVGYGTQKKENLTGAVSVVNMEKVLGDRPVTSVGAALQGAVPGLQITGGASPGESKVFNVRGTTSITETGYDSNTLPGPLVLIDNVECQIDLINPEDIETVTLLKDAASAAIYGARAAYGVILITTKKAKKNSKMILNYNNNFAFEKVTNRLKPASVKDLVNAYSEWNPGGSWTSNGQPFALWLDYINEYEKNPLAFQAKTAQNDEYFNTRWGMYTPKTGTGAGKYFYLKDNDAQNEIFDCYGFQQTHNISASGGGEKITYRLSLGYLDADGPLKTDKDNYQRINVSSYVSADITSWMNTAVDIRYTQGSRLEMESDWERSIFNSGYHNFLPGADSWTAASDPDGTLYLNTAPLNYLVHGNSRTVRNENPRIFSRTVFTPFKGFEGVLEYNYDENVYDRKMYPNTLNMRSDQMMAVANADPTYEKAKSASRYTSFNAYGTYSLTLADRHNFKLMAGFSQERRYYEYLWANRKNAINPDIPSITGSEGIIEAGDDYVDYAIRSGFFRFNYNYAGRYLLEINGRYDGSSKFPKNYRFGFFPSFSAGWQVARESFMKWSAGWLNEFKIRGSWGEIGNQAIGNYQFLPEMSVSLLSNWIYGTRRPTTLNPPAMVRENFTWERAATLDIGTDISMLNNRLQTTFSWYRRDTKDMLGPAAEYPSVVGTTAPLQNVADLRTKGIELAVNWRDRIGEWGYSVGFNLADYRSHIVRYNNEAKLFRDRNSAYTVREKRYYEDMEFGEIWGYRFDRFYTVDDFENTTSWALKPGVTSLKGYAPRPGDIMFRNLSDETGDNEINDGAGNLDDPGDMTVIGNETPRYQYGVTAGVSYRGFDLSMFIQGTGKQDVWLGGNITFPLVGTNNNNDDMGTMYGHQTGNYVQVENAANGDYTLVNPDARYPRIYGQPGVLNESNRRISDRYLLDASYLRVKNITLSYTFPHNLVQTIGLSNARVFLSAENVFTISNLPKGVDPERISWGYPFYAIWSFGVNITL